ncbi:MAG: phage portal protein [Miltoncostaeaceae bacterium]
MASEVGTPRWWLERLERELIARRARMLLLDDYYSGRHPLPFLTRAHNRKMNDEFAQLLQDSRSNFCRLVVDAVEERLRVDGFRLSASEDEAADRGAWAIWQANQMDSESQTAFVEALTKGVSYLSVWSGDDHPVIAVEDPLQTIVEYEPGTGMRRRAAALKIWDDEISERRRANLYLPAGIHKFSAPLHSAPGVLRPAPTDTGGWREMEGNEAFVANPLGIVPIVPLRNRPRLLLEGESDLADVVDTQDRINGQLFLRCLAGYFGAHRQRWAVGLKIHEDDNGTPVEPFDVAIDRLWQVEDPNVSFGEFAQTDLGGYIRAIEQDVLHIAVTTRTPRHYLIESGQSPSGDAIRSAESGLVKKVQRKMRSFGEGLEEAIRLARLFAGERETPVDSEIVWADAETRTEAETTDAVIKQYQAGLIPWAAALERLGYTQTAISRFAGLRARDDLMRALFAEDAEDGEDGAPAVVPAEVV